jgi:hypothetical protein
LVEKAAGQAFKLTSHYEVMPQQLIVVVASFAKYFTQPMLGNTQEVDFDANYHFQRLKGLSARYRIGQLKDNVNMGRFVYQRFMLEYAF